jgi:hypothetical protein
MDEDNGINPWPTNRVGRCDKCLLPDYSCDCGPPSIGRPARVTGGMIRITSRRKINERKYPVPRRRTHVSDLAAHLGAYDARAVALYGYPAESVVSRALTTEEVKSIAATMAAAGPGPLIERAVPIPKWLREARAENGLTGPYPTIMCRPTTVVTVGKVTYLPAKKRRRQPMQFRYPRYCRWVEPDFPDFPAKYLTPSQDSVQIHLARLSADFDEEDAPAPLEWTIYSRRVKNSGSQDALPPLPRDDVDDWIDDAERKAQMQPQAGRGRGRPREEGVRTPSGQLSRAKDAGDLGTEEVQERRRRISSCYECGRQISDPALAAAGAAGLLRAHEMIDEAQYNAARDLAITRAKALSPSETSARMHAYNARKYAVICNSLTREWLSELHSLVVDDAVPEWAQRSIAGAENNEAAGDAMSTLLDALDALTRLDYGAQLPEPEDNPGRPATIWTRVCGFRDHLID